MRLVWHFALAALRDGIRLRGEPGDAFFMPKNRERMTRSDQYVESEVELETVEEVRIRHVTLRNVVQSCIVL